MSGHHGTDAGRLAMLVEHRKFHQQRGAPAVLRRRGDFALDHPPALDRAAVLAGNEIRELLGVEVGRGLAEHDVLATPGELLERLVDEGVAPLQVLQRHHHRRVLHHRLELRLVGAQRRVGLGALLHRGCELIGLRADAPVGRGARPDRARDRTLGGQQQNQEAGDERERDHRLQPPRPQGLAFRQRDREQQRRIADRAIGVEIGRAARLIR